MDTIIRNATIVNEGKLFASDIQISNGRISKIAPVIDSLNNVKEINAEGLLMIPGMIDDQVHFREPGLTHKGSIYTESRAAVAGGITSFMDMPNTIPNVLTLEALECKYQIAANNSLANYSFFMGINKKNLEEVLKVDNEKVCGVTDDGLYFHDDEGMLANYPQYLEQFFGRVNTLLALHCEDELIIKRQEQKYKEIYGQNIPFQFHSAIRNEESCLAATKRVIELSKKYRNRLHLFHISTLAEANLLDNDIAITDKKITGEACIHHLWFSDFDYQKLGAKIKWNPSIKTRDDKEGLMRTLLENKLDIIATDHAPHTLLEKSGNYFEAYSGGPMVQHALIVLLELYHQNKISLEKIVEKTSHNVAEIYRIIDRGYIREGYFADLVLIDLSKPFTVNSSNILYKCNWSPLENNIFRSQVVKTFVNGNEVYSDGVLNSNLFGMRLSFQKDR